MPKLTVTSEVGTGALVESLAAEAREVGAAMRRIVDAGLRGSAPNPDDLDQANTWLRAVGA